MAIQHVFIMLVVVRKQISKYKVVSTRLNENITVISINN